MRIKFEPRDLWIGLYWKRDPGIDFESGTVFTLFTFYVCIIPCLPIIFRYVHKKGGGQ